MPALPSTIRSSAVRRVRRDPAPIRHSAFVPNPNLRPEVGKNKEIGFNLKKNDLFTSGDSFRGKFNVFRNDITDFIDQVAFGTPLAGSDRAAACAEHYRSAVPAVPEHCQARIQGFEAETMYDANLWFVGVAGSYQQGKNLQTGFGLYSIPPQKITTTAGVRLLDRTLVLSVMWTSAVANKNIPPTYTPATGYDLVNLYAQYQPTRDLTLNFSVENLLNQYYRPYAIPVGSSDGRHAERREMGQCRTRHRIQGWPQDITFGGT